MSCGVDNNHYCHLCHALVQAQRIIKGHSQFIRDGLGGASSQAACPFHNHPLKPHRSQKPDGALHCLHKWVHQPHAPTRASLELTHMGLFSTLFMHDSQLC